MCHPILVPSYLQEFDEANKKVGAEQNPQKTEVICFIEDLDAAPPERKVDDVQRTAAVSIVTAGSTTIGVAVGRASNYAPASSALSGPADRIRSLS